ncbi:MAG: aspartate dehydrogenase [Thermoplasmata archaeon]|nr:aspartate dehydrogenase [Thermoplasmata archaeon]
MNILIIGCGSIGTVITKAADKMQSIEKILLYDIDSTRADQLLSISRKAEMLSSLDLEKIDVSIGIEAAGQKAAKEYVPTILENGIDAMVMSVGAFVDRDFQQRCYKAVEAKGRLVLIPSGAVAGVDALRSASKAKIDVVKLTSTKPPKGLSGVKYLQEKGIKVEELKERTILYSGPAGQAVQLFPANVNVAATVSLAGIGFDSTQVDVVCDPATKVNSHHLYAKGEFGELEATTRNLPSPDNPKTSYLASLSAVSTLISYVSKIWTGV